MLNLDVYKINIESTLEKMLLYKIYYVEIGAIAVGMEPGCYVE